MSQSGARKASLERKTRETEIRLDLDLDGSGDYDIATGIPFFDHMLESFAKHALFNLHLRAKGDLEVDLHHTVEDVGIALGSALREARGEARGIRRYGFQVLPMAEAKVEVSVDLKHNSVCCVLDDAGFAALAEGSAAFAEYEGFPAHAMAVRRRHEATRE